MTIGSNVLPIEPGSNASGSIDKKKERKKRVPNETRDKSVSQLFGEFLRLLRKRVGLTCEELAKKLGYQRPTQVIRREAGLLNIPSEDVEKVALILKCDEKLFYFLRMASFDAKQYKIFGKSLNRDINYGSEDDIYFIIGNEIVALEEDIQRSGVSIDNPIWCGAKHKQTIKKRYSALK